MGEIHLAVGLQGREGFATSVWDANLDVANDRASLATFAETGSISGIAWDRFGRQLFVGSALKRHTDTRPRHGLGRHLRDPRRTGPSSPVGCPSGWNHRARRESR